MEDVHHTGAAQQVTPQRSPPFLSVGHNGDGRYFSCLEADRAKTFFHFSSPARVKDQPFTKNE